MNDYEFEQAREAYEGLFQPVQKLRLMYKGDNSGNDTVSGDPSLMWVHDQAGNLERVKRGPISNSAPANTPLLIGETPGYSSNFGQAAAVFTDQIDGYSGESYLTAYVGGVGAVGFADSQGNLTGDADHFFWDETYRELILTSEGEVQGPGMWLVDYSNSQNSFIAARRARGTSALPTAVQTGDVLFRWSAFGRGTTGFSGNSDVRIEFDASQTHTDTAHGTQVDVYTTANDTDTITKVVTIAEDGLIEALFGMAIKRTLASGALTIPDGYSMVVSGYYSLTGSASLSLAGDAELKVI